jgi:hypothetical protein
MVPILRLLSIWEERWRALLPVAPDGITTSNLIASAVNADWGGVFAASSIAITAVGRLGIRPSEVPISTQGNRSRVEDDTRAESIEPRSDFPDASVDPTEARKDAGHAGAVGGTELE